MTGGGGGGGWKCVPLRSVQDLMEGKPGKSWGED